MLRTVIVASSNISSEILLLFRPNYFDTALPLLLVDDKTALISPS
jgi:hypothetical protein